MPRLSILAAVIAVMAMTVSSEVTTKTPRLPSLIPKKAKLQICVKRCAASKNCNYVERGPGGCILQQVDLAAKGFIRPNKTIPLPSPLHPAVAKASSQCIYQGSIEPTRVPLVLYPLYGGTLSVDGSTCTDPHFVAVARGCKAVTAIINPSYGPLPPGNRAERNLRICMNMLSRNGVKMVGYVHTKEASQVGGGIWAYSGFRDISDVKREVKIWAQYRDIPNFRGIFVDEVSSNYQTLTWDWGADHNAYYRQVISHARTYFPLGSGNVILNPGTVPHVDLVRSDPRADVSVPFENNANSWRPTSGDCKSTTWADGNWRWGSFPPGPWCPMVPGGDGIEDYKWQIDYNRHFGAAIVHGAPGLDWAMNEARVAKANKFRFFFATNRKISQNPWATTPSYWDDYLRFLNRVR